MAKLKAPLLSLGASGAIGKSLVFFPWKGIDAVREYVVPANPRTAGQIAQRGYLEDAVDAWHDAPFTASDLTAWNRLAGIAAKIMSGFNRMCQEFIKEIIDGNAWERVRNCTVDGVTANTFNVHIQKIGGGNAPTCRYGKSKTHFPDSQVLADEGGATWGAALAGLDADTLYYFTFDVGTRGTDWGRLGIYQQRTS